MADENDPNAAPPADPAPPPAPDYSAKFAAMEAQLAEEREARQRERQEAEARHQETLAQVAGAIGSLREPPPAVAEDEGAIITRGDLKRELAESMSTIASATQNTITQEGVAVLQNLRQTNRTMALNDPSLKYLGKYAKEVDAALDKMPPHLAARPNAYKEVYNFVVSKHADEVKALEEPELRERIRAEILAEMDPDYEPAPAAGTPAAPAAPVRRDPPMPRGDGGRQAISSPGGQGRMPKLTSDEQWACERYFGGDRAAYLKERDQPTTGEAIFRAKR